MAEWSDYQEEVAEFFRSIGLQADTNVTLKGVRTSHDIDVVVRSNHIGFDLLWLVECKHWKTAVTKLHVLALREIVSELGADRGVLMAESGFQRGAREAAQLTNVQLTSLAALTTTASDALGRAQLRALQERIENGLRDEQGGGYSGHHILQIINAALNSASQDQPPVIGAPLFGEIAIAMADPKLHAAETLNELIECLEPMVAGLEAHLRQTDLAKAANEVTRWREMSALTDDLLPGPARSIYLSNIDPVEYSKSRKTGIYTFSDLTDEVPPEFEDFITRVRRILEETKSSLESISYDKAHDYVTLTPSGYITPAQSDKITEAGRNLPVKYLFTALLYDA
jgi:restriction system protein